MFEPPKKLKSGYYRCDNKFHLDTIVDMFEDDNIIGVCLISGKDLIIYRVTISGSYIDSALIKKREIVLPNKHNKGGQSSVRFGRIADIVREKYVTIIAETIVSTFMHDNNTKCNVQKIILAGSGDMKNDVANDQLFKQFLSKHLYKIINVNNFDDSTALDIISNIIGDMQSDDVKKIDAEINDLVQNHNEMLSYGEEMTLNLIFTENNIKKLFVNKLILSQDMKDNLSQAKETLKMDIFFTDSAVLKMYGDWMGVKKY